MNNPTLPGQTVDAPKKTIRRPSPLPHEVSNAIGRPGLYCDHYPELAHRLALVGLTDKEMASVFGISVDALYDWDKAHPDFLQSRAKGGVVADGLVAAKLYHRAIGYDYEAVKIFMPAGAKEPVYAPYVEHVPPDIQAITWWLKNRQKRHWQDKVDVNISGSVNVTKVPYDPERLSVEHREALRDALLSLEGPIIEGESEKED